MVVILGIANWIALEHHLYFSYRWFDIPMHFLGGIWLSFCFLWYYYTYQQPGLRRTVQEVFAIALSGTLTVALLWELFEYLVNFYIILNAYDVLDTIKDLVIGMAGGLTGATIFYEKKYYKP